jgi:hypothetical protein
MHVKEVSSKKLLKDFVLCASNFYSEDVNYIPHLKQDILALFDVQKNSLLKDGKIAAWILLDDSSIIIGRIAAFYDANQRLSKIGGIGFFECINDVSAAKMLFSTAENWLKKEGFIGADGPINFGERDKYWGLLTSPEVLPSYQENYNPMYYQHLFESNAFQLHFQQLTSEISMGTFNLDRFQKLAQRVYQNPTYQFEHLKRNQINRFANDFVSIYNQAWQHRSDFVPITLDRILATFNSLKPILIEEGIWFAYANKQPVGFYVAIPEVNQLFKHANGNLNWIAKIKFLYYRYFGKLERMRGLVFGIVPAYQNLGLETGLIIKFYEAMLKTKYYRKCELAWIGDFNPKMQSMINALGAKTSKIHYTYRKMFSL